MLTAHLRRPANLVLFLVSAVVLGLHLGLRDAGWRYEWLWALLQLGFATVFLGPVAAASAAHEGGQWQRLEPDARPASSRLRVGVRVWTGQAGAVLLAYLGALAIVAGIVHGSGTPGWPGAGEVGAVLAAVALLVGWSAAGTAVGVRTGPSRLVPSLVLVVALALSILGYLVPGHVTDVGGSTSSLVGSRVVPGLFASQVTLWLAVCLLAGAFLLRWGRSAAVAVGVAACLVAAAFAWQVSLGTERLEPSPAAVRCRPIGSAVVCLAPGYEQFRSRGDAALSGPIALLHDAVPGRHLVFTQDASFVGARDDVAYLGLRTLRGSRSDAAWTAANALVPVTCTLASDLEAARAFDALPHLLLVPPSAVSAEVVGAIRTRVAALAECRSGPT